MQRHIKVWQVHGYWMYALWIAGRCVVIGRASTHARSARVRRTLVAVTLFRLSWANTVQLGRAHVS
jgi:hypothetical protein